MKELLRKVRKLDIKIRRMVESTFAGEYRSAFRGQGLEFDEVRAYQYGDDIRSIDWNVTARSDTVYVKLFREEREQEVFVIFDISGSLDFGIQGQHKKDIGTEIAAIFAYSALKNNDRLGLMLSTDRVEKYYKPMKGNRHVMTLIQNLLEYQAENKGTQLRQALELFRRTHKKRCILIVISDFMDEGYTESIEKLSRQHEVIMIRLFHPLELKAISGGILPVQDQESGMIRWVGTGSGAIQDKVKAYMANIHERLTVLARRKHTWYLPVDVSKDYIPELEKFFKRIHASHSR
jgi:uncharacterized protein (DUF58 family)